MTDAVRAFLQEQPVGVLGTQRRDGSLRQTPVYHVLDGDRVVISTLGKRAKARDVRRTGRASYCVLAHAKPYASVTVEGPARIVSSGIAAPTARLMARITGQEPANQLTDEMLASMDRVILELHVEHVYGVSYV
jgi:PPOX class probable F420-dependent enzyme